MTTRKYVVLELARPLNAGATIVQQFAAEADSTQGPKVEVADLTDKEVRDLQTSDRYGGHAPEIPVELVRPVAATAQPTNMSRAWGIEAVGAHESEFDGEGVSVAVLDTGIDLEHDAFRSIRSRIEVRDYSGAGSGDSDGHGTHCAGTIFGQDVDGTRIGVARNIKKALIGRVFDDDGRASSIGLFRALKDAIMETRVVSMSLGFDFPGMVERLVVQQGIPLRLAASNALQDFLSNIRIFDTFAKLGRELVSVTGGSVLVAAAGNESKPTFRVALAQPASADGVISVGAIERSDKGFGIATFSNSGPTVSAPGVDILSASPQRDPEDPKLKTMSGTSMATPHVAGIAALWFQALPLVENQPAFATTVMERLRTRVTTTFRSGVTWSERGQGQPRAPRAV